MRKIALFLFMLTLALAGCGQAGPATPGTSLPTSGVTARPTIGATDMPPATSTMVPTTMPPTIEAAQPDAPQDAIVTVARARLAAYLGVKEEALTLQSAAAKEWPDGAIGCPQAGMMYPQIVTPGYLIVFSTAGKTYQVHTGREEAIILCENNNPTPLSGASSAQPTPPAGDTSSQPPLAPQPTDQPAAGDLAALGPGASAMAAMARNALAKDLGIAANNVTIVSAEEVQWSDGSLGCPRPGMMYPQVITPGYRVTLEAGGKRYTYHTDMRQRVIRCDNPAPRGQVTK